MLLKTIINKLGIKNFHKRCYDGMYMLSGYIGDDGKCTGVVGVTKSTGYLSESCVDCPYRNKEV